MSKTYEKSQGATKMAVNRRWLVRNRSRVQHRMLRLDELSGFFEGSGLADKRTIWAIYGTLVGVVFSLWRAVFLIQSKRDLDDEILDGGKLLGILIDTNAVSFPQDVLTAQWTAGYYLNNATLRLYSLGQDALTRRHLRPMTVEFLNYFKPEVMMSIQLVDVELRQSWERALKGFDEIFRDLKAAMSDKETFRTPGN